MEARFVALRFRTTVDEEDALQGFLMMNATVEGIEETSDGTVVFCIPRDEWNDEFKALLNRFIDATESTELLESSLLEEKDWNAEWESSIEPLQITKQLVIAPSWKMEEAQKLDAEYLIRIDPKMSFGTGHHETTRLCLMAIESLSVSGAHVLDIGTGSGVLAIYALLRGAPKAVGIDTDPWSIENVKENRELNGLPYEQFDVRQGTLETAVAEHEKFGIILANIHRNVLIGIASQIGLHAEPGAAIVLSGLLIYDVDEVRAAFELAGFTFVRELREKEWAALIFEAATNDE